MFPLSRICLLLCCNPTIMKSWRFHDIPFIFCSCSFGSVPLEHENVSSIFLVSITGHQNLHLRFLSFSSCPNFSYQLHPFLTFHFNSNGHGPIFLSPYFSLSLFPSLALSFKDFRRLLKHYSISKDLSLKSSYFNPMTFVVT